MSVPAPAQATAALRSALRLIAYGLYVVTTASEREVHAITFNWLTQISFSPLLVLAAVENTSHTRALLAATGIFAVNFLGAHQVDLARRLAVPHKMNPHKLAGIAYTAGANGAPLLTEASGYLECRIQQTLEVGGDHTLFVAEVTAGAVTSDRPPLTLSESRLRYK